MATGGLGTGKNLCRHCKRFPDYRPRGLCWRCYYTPAVRALYPAMSPQESGREGGRQYRPSLARKG